MKPDLNKPDKILKYTQPGTSRTYQIYLYASLNKAFLVAPGQKEPAFSYGPINNLDVIKISVIFRKAIRYLNGLERDFKKLENVGFEPLSLPNPTDAPPEPKQAEKKKPEPNRPLWQTTT